MRFGIFDCGAILDFCLLTRFDARRPQAYAHTRSYGRVQCTRRQARTENETHSTPIARHKLSDMDKPWLFSFFGHAFVALPLCFFHWISFFIIHSFVATAWTLTCLCRSIRPSMCQWPAEISYQIEHSFESIIIIFVVVPSHLMASETYESSFLSIRFGCFFGEIKFRFARIFGTNSDPPSIGQQKKFFLQTSTSTINNRNMRNVCLFSSHHSLPMCVVCTHEMCNLSLCDSFIGSNRTHTELPYTRACFLLSTRPSDWMRVSGVESGRLYDNETIITIRLILICTLNGLSCIVHLYVSHRVEPNDDGVNSISSPRSTVRCTYTNTTYTLLLFGCLK